MKIGLRTQAGYGIIDPKMPHKEVKHAVKQDAFSKCHPLVNFLFFLGAIGFGVVIQHPAYVVLSCICGGVYYLLLSGRSGWKLILGMLPVLLAVAAVNPLFNLEGETVLFMLFGRPYTLEALLYGASVGGVFVVMMLWFGCYNKVLTSDKFISLFGTAIPSLSLLLVMVLRMIPNLQRKARQILGARRSIGKGAGETAEKKEKLADGMRSLSALTDWALEGSIVTADSMRARGYGTARRTGFQIYRITGRDMGLLAVMLVLAAVVLLLGNTEAVFVPTLSVPEPGWGLAAYGAFLLIPTAMHLFDALRWHIAMAAYIPGREKA